MLSKEFVKFFQSFAQIITIVVDVMIYSNGLYRIHGHFITASSV